MSLEFNFKDLTNITNPDKPSLPSITSDKSIYNYNPERYKFYMQFIDGLNNPSTLRKVLYKYADVRNNKKVEEEKIKNIVKGLKTLYMYKREKDITGDKLQSDKEFLDNKKKREDEINNNIINRIKSVLYNKYQNFNTDSVNDNIERTFIDNKKILGGNKIKGGKNPNPIVDGQPIVLKDEEDNEKQKEKQKENILKLNVPNVDDEFYNVPKPLENYKEDLIKIKNIDTSQIVNDAQYNELKNIVYKIENDPAININSLKITYEDRFIFIAITFFIRLISVYIVEWIFNTNYITTFEYCFYFYTFIYITIFLLITTITNLVYNYPLKSIFTGDVDVNLPLYMYYFYITTNGAFRLLLHIFIILMLIVIPFVIKNSNSSVQQPAYDIQSKRKVIKILNNFTLLIWILTSIIAIKF